ncbi:hypothetical protein [Cellulomonas soli]|uniref:Uncharacterized protein n=1 Tax=Cellulomonas soli TaxID=931535 RepID=A0A512PB08_9CELL|nr:hypothetical protein [Cellulomonas soli]NYI57342.1 hypothetical protein [Cellulomonas soli]GEP68378.1 hypothetical protein CSO01_10930 [Cellulomonas soli]
MSEPTPDDTQSIKDLLAEHVPLALLVDLLGAERRTSSEILAEEGLPEDAWWEDSTDDGSGAEAGPGNVER